MRKISRKAAKANGRRLYFTGKSCPHGHVAPRRTDSSQCVECAREGAAAWRDENQKHIAAYYKSYFAKPDHKRKRLEYMRAFDGSKGNASTRPRKRARPASAQPLRAAFFEEAHKS
jgi:hypothetical protein